MYLSTGNNDGTYDKLVISNNEDASNSTRDPGITSQFYQIYDAKLLNAHHLMDLIKHSLHKIQAQLNQPSGMKIQVQ